jgi:hypothetical protein
MGTAARVAYWRQMCFPGSVTCEDCREAKTSLALVNRQFIKLTHKNDVDSAVCLKVEYFEFMWVWRMTVCQLQLHVVTVM